MNMIGCVQPHVNTYKLKYEAKSIPSYASWTLKTSYNDVFSDYFLHSLDFLLYHSDSLRDAFNRNNYFVVEEFLTFWMQSETANLFNI